MPAVPTEPTAPVKPMTPADQPAPTKGALYVLGCLGAGGASALICYFEYLGMGAFLGSKLLGYGDQGKSVAVLLIVLSAIVACLVFAARGVPYLAGPRGASLSALLLALAQLQKDFPLSAASQQISLLAFLLLGSVLALAFSSTRWAQAVIKGLPKWLMPSFIFASAISIIIDATSKYLLGCLQRNELQTWLIVVPACIFGVVWHFQMEKKARNLKERNDKPVLTPVVSMLQGSGLMFAAVAAWLAFEFSALAAPQAGLCARLGVMDLDWHMLTSRVNGLLHTQGASQLWAAWLWAIAFGILVGFVAAIESQTTWKTLVEASNPDDCTHPTPESLLRTNTLVAALLLPTTSVVSSASLSRTKALTMFMPATRLSITLHAISLAAIALLASQWLARLPQIALVVLMTLVATQMLTSATTEIWKQAHNPGVSPEIGILAGSGFWFLVGLSLFLKSSLYALVAVSVLYYVWIGLERLIEQMRPVRNP